MRFCIENDLSFPKETSEFFKGKIDGCDLEDYLNESILEYIENGIEVDMPMVVRSEFEYHINVADIPIEASLIIVNLS